MRNKVYLLLPFQVLVEIPYVIVQVIIYGVIVYAMIGFEWTVVKFIWYLFFMFFTFMYFTFFGMMTVAMTPNPDIAAIIAAACYGAWNLFSGFIIPRPVSYCNSILVYFFILNFLFFREKSK